MEITNRHISDYIEKNSSAEPELLKKLARDTYAHVLMPRMLSGHIQGRLLSLISKMLRPSLILEVGTFTGYSALCLAEGLEKNGTLHTIDINEELEDLVSHYIEMAGMKEKIIQHIGNALDLIPTFQDGIDLAFIDADKINYLNYYHLLKPKINPGGFILADNVLWGGKVIAEENPKPDKDTRAILEFNETIAADPEVEKVILSVRDGITVIRKI